MIVLVVPVGLLPVSLSPYTEALPVLEMKYGLAVLPV